MNVDKIMNSICYLFYPLNITFLQEFTHRLVPRRAYFTNPNSHIIYNLHSSSSTPLATINLLLRKILFERKVQISSCRHHHRLCGISLQQFNDKKLSIVINYIIISYVVTKTYIHTHTGTYRCVRLTIFSLILHHL